jgi:hypothetical protein
MNRSFRLAASASPAQRAYDNQVDVFDPQFWANESLAVLEENMVIGGLVHRDFEPILQNFGDTVNTRRVGEFKAKRKATTDNVTVQDATAANIAVVLNHHVHVSFLIRDGEESKAVTSLIDEYMAPAMISEARYVDQVLLGQVYRFLRNAYGRLGNLTNADVVDRITGVRNLMNNNKAGMMNRNLILTPNTETTFLRNPDFTRADKVGDNGTALREASLGRLYGINHFTSQNASSITATATVVGAVNQGSAAVGAVTLTVDGFSGAVLPGSWFTVSGDDTPQRVTSVTNTLGATTVINFTPGLRKGILDNAPVTVYTPGAVNFGGGYAKGWVNGITVSGFSVAPKLGQLITFGTASDVYSVIDVTGTTTIVVDRPLDAAINNTDVVGVGPAGEYNLAFLRNALAMVVRPLATPRQGTGALASVVNLNGLSMRCVITYDGNKQGHLVTLDMLMGYQVLDDNLGAVLLG